MPVYDCGVPECSECQTAFGPDRTAAIAKQEKREKYYAAIDLARKNHTSPPCRVCMGSVAIYSAENLFDAICPDCCGTAIHSDGETGHEYKYERAKRDSVCQKCGVTEHDDDGYISDRERI